MAHNDHDRTILDEMRERQSHVVTFTLKDETDAPVAKAVIGSFILDFRDMHTRAVINGREHQDVLDANQVTVHDTSGLVTWEMLPEDTPFGGSDDSGRQIRQLEAHFYVVWDGGEKETGHIIEFRVRNIKDYPVDVSP